MTDSTDSDLKAKLNCETAKIEWQMLQAHYQQEGVIFVSEQLDLVQVALELAQDNHQQMKNWLDQQLVAKVSPEQHQHWQQRNLQLWAVVVAPWVLVQEVRDEQK